MKKTLAVFLFVFAFAAAALAAEVVDLAQVSGIETVISKLGAPSSRIGTMGVVYTNGVSKEIKVGGQWSVNTPAYPRTSAPAGTLVPAGTPLTLFWLGSNPPAQPSPTPQPNPQPAPQPAPQPNPQPAPQPAPGSEKVVNSQWELNDFVREHGGKLGKAENLPSFALSYQVGGKAPKFGDKLPAFTGTGELLSGTPVSGDNLTVVDREAYFSFAPSNIAEVKALALYPLRQDGAEVKDAGHGVLIKGFVGDWKVAKGFRVNTERGALREGDIVRGGEWGTVYGAAVEKPAPKPAPAPGGSSDTGGGGGGCDSGMGFAALLLIPLFVRGRRNSRS